MKTKEQRKSRTDQTSRAGMTIAEVLIFMTLTLFVMGGMFPLLQQGQRIDALSEEKMAAFFAGESTIEELRSNASGDWTESGFQQKSNKKGTYFKRTRKDVPFHKKGNQEATNLEAKEIVKLIPQQTGSVSNYLVTVKLTWTSASRFGNNGVATETVTALLFP